MHLSRLLHLSITHVQYLLKILLTWWYQVYKSDYVHRAQFVYFNYFLLWETWLIKCWRMDLVDETLMLDLRIHFSIQFFCSYAKCASGFWLIKGSIYVWMCNVGARKICFTWNSFIQLISNSTLNYFKCSPHIPVDRIANKCSM